VAYQLTEHIVIIRDLDRGIAERAATAFLVLDRDQMRFEQRLDLTSRIVRMRGNGRVPVLPHLALLFAQVFGDQLVLGREAAIEAHLVGAGFRGNGIDTYAAYAVAIEQLARGIEDPIAYARFGTRALRFVPGSIIVGSVHFFLGSS
jgi:hypothetical protein